MRKYIFYGLALAVAWIFVTGTPTAPTFVQGLFFGIPMSFAFRRFYPGEIKLIQLEKTPLIFEYIIMFLEGLMISNIQVAYSLLTPSKTVNPEMIEYSSELENPTALAVLADSITLTPGTLVVDHIEKENKLVIHCLDGSNTEETREDIRKWEKILARALE